MDFLASLAIAFALAIDAFAVSVASGISLQKVSARQTFRLAFHFGLFQSLMTFLGWLGGTIAKPLIESFDHWLAFALLMLIGCKMIFDAISEGEETQFRYDPTKGWSMILLSIATSVDAMAVGLGFSTLKISILFPVIIIGVVASAMTILGLHLGETASKWKGLSRYSQILGALVLFAIGIKILFEHGVI